MRCGGRGSRRSPDHLAMASKLGHHRTHAAGTVEVGRRHHPRSRHRVGSLASATQRRGCADFPATLRLTSSVVSHHVSYLLATSFSQAPSGGHFLPAPPISDLSQAAEKKPPSVTTVSPIQYLSLALRLGDAGRTGSGIVCPSQPCTQCRCLRCLSRARVHL